MVAFSIQDGPKKVITVDFNDIRRVDTYDDKIEIFLKPNGILVLLPDMPEFNTFPNAWKSNQP